MNFKRFGRTANLFDKDNANIYEAYFNNDGYWRQSLDSKSVKIPCLPNTQYTLSVPNSLAIFRLYETDNIDIEPKASDTDANKATKITRSEYIRQYTFTTSSTTQAILFQGSYAAFNEWLNGLMLNSGSTALPYQPYKDWANIPYYQHKTATDTLTLPAVIYPNDTSITVGIKGNTGGVGDLVESGEHAEEYVIPIVCNGVTTNIYRNAPLDISDSLTTSIPCTAGENTLDVQTTVQPSEVTAAYHGWHTGTVHERVSGAWT